VNLGHLINAFPLLGVMQMEF